MIEVIILPPWPSDALFTSWPLAAGILLDYEKYQFSLKESVSTLWWSYARQTRPSEDIRGRDGAGGLYIYCHISKGMNDVTTHKKVTIYPNQKPLLRSALCWKTGKLHSGLVMHSSASWNAVCIGDFVASLWAGWILREFMLPSYFMHHVSAVWETSSLLCEMGWFLFFIYVSFFSNFLNLTITLQVLNSTYYQFGGAKAEISL